MELQKLVDTPSTCGADMPDALAPVDIDRTSFFDKILLSGYHEIVLTAITYFELIMAVKSSQTLERHR